MLPDPVLVLDNGSIYAGLLLAAIVGGGFGFIASGMAMTAQFKPIRVVICCFGVLGALGGWFAPAMDVSQYDWFEWYDGLLFPLRVLITPEYYTSFGAVLLLVLPSIVILCAVVFSILRLIAESTRATYADDGEEAELRDAG